MKFINSIRTNGGINTQEKTYYVAFTGMQNYISWIGVAMASIMEHNQAHFMFHILLDKTTEEDVSAFEEFAQHWNVSIVLYYMNDEAPARYSKFNRYFIDGRYIPTLVYRFVVPDVVASHIKWILYLDGDIVCNGDITEFMGMNLEGNIVGGFRRFKG